MPAAARTKNLKRLLVKWRSEDERRRSSDGRRWYVSSDEGSVTATVPTWAVAMAALYGLVTLAGILT